MKNIFLKKSYTKSAGETIPRPVCKSPKLKKPEYGSVAQRFVQFDFIVCQVEDYRNILKQSCRPPTCFYLI